MQILSLAAASILLTLIFSGCGPMPTQHHADNNTPSEKNKKIKALVKKLEKEKQNLLKEIDKLKKIIKNNEDKNNQGPALKEKLKTSKEKKVNVNLPKPVIIDHDSSADAYPTTPSNAAADKKKKCTESSDDSENNTDLSEESSN